MDITKDPNNNPKEEEIVLFESDLLRIKMNELLVIDNSDHKNICDLFQNMFSFMKSLPKTSQNGFLPKNFNGHVENAVQLGYRLFKSEDNQVNPEDKVLFEKIAKTYESHVNEMIKLESPQEIINVYECLKLIENKGVSKQQIPELYSEFSEVLSAIDPKDIPDIVIEFKEPVLEPWNKAFNDYRTNVSDNRCENNLDLIDELKQTFNGPIHPQQIMKLCKQALDMLGKSLLEEINDQLLLFHYTDKNCAQLILETGHFKPSIQPKNKRDDARYGSGFYSTSLAPQTHREETIVSNNYNSNKKFEKTEMCFVLPFNELGETVKCQDPKAPNRDIYLTKTKDVVKLEDMSWFMQWYKLPKQYEEKDFFKIMAKNGRIDIYYVSKNKIYGVLTVNKKKMSEKEPGKLEIFEKNIFRGKLTIDENHEIIIREVITIMEIDLD